MATLVKRQQYRWNRRTQKYHQAPQTASAAFERSIASNQQVSQTNLVFDLEHILMAQGTLTQ